MKEIALGEPSQFYIRSAQSAVAEALQNFQATHAELKRRILLLAKEAGAPEGSEWSIQPETPDGPMKLVRHEPAPQAAPAPVQPPEPKKKEKKS